jgi:hypothetical protein
MKSITTCFKNEILIGFKSQKLDLREIYVFHWYNIFFISKSFSSSKLSVELKGKKGNLLINEGCVV